MLRLLFLFPFLLCANGTAFTQNSPGVPFQQPSVSQNAQPKIVLETKLIPENPTTPFSDRPDTPFVYQFDPKHVEVRRIEHRWVLVVDSVLLRDFGMRETDAHEAVRIIQALHLNQVGTIGTPQPVMEFWLSDGHAPIPTIKDLHTIPLDLNKLTVQQIKNDWVIRDGTRVLGSFGVHRELAFQALDLIRLYGFNQQGVIGYPMPSMTYFLANPNEKSRWDSGSSHEIQSTLQPNHKATAFITQAVSEKRLHFDPSRVEICEDHHQWKIVVGNHVLANLGTEQYLAKQAQQVIQYYRFSEMNMIGTTEKGFRYFLVNGQAPVGVRFGVQAQPLRPDSLLIRQVGNHCMVCDGDVPIMNFDQRMADAQHFVRIVQHFHFDRLCCVGSMSGQGLTFLAKSR